MVKVLDKQNIISLYIKLDCINICNCFNHLNDYGIFFAMF